MLAARAPVRAPVLQKFCRHGQVSIRPPWVAAHARRLGLRTYVRQMYGVRKIHVSALRLFGDLSVIAGPMAKLKPLSY